MYRNYRFLCQFFSLLFKPHKKKRYNSFSAAVVYVDLQKNKNKVFSNKFGELVVRFENAELAESENTLSIYNNFGSMVIEVPAELYCVCNVKTKFGELVAPRNIAAETSAKLKIEGKNNFGEVIIKTV